MRTIGQILKEERERKFYTLEEVEKATKIRKEFLEALEKGEYQRLPPATFIQGFIKNYGKFLGLDEQKLLAIFRREFSDQKHPPKILDSFSNPLEKGKFKLTPAKFLGGLILGLVIIFFIYLWIEYRFLVDSPFLEILSPTDQMSTQLSAVEVSGRTDPEAKVKINDQEIQVDISGRFTQEITLTENVNFLKITSTSKSGKVTTLERTVFLRQ